jgi:arsenate reductase
MIKFYGYKKCATSRKAEKTLTDSGIEYAYIDITLNPPSKAQLKKIIELTGEPLKKFVNVSGLEYKRLKMKDKIGGISEQELIDLLASNGRLLKRPLVSDGEKATVGFSMESFLQNWKQ